MSTAAKKKGRRAIPKTQKKIIHNISIDPATLANGKKAAFSSGVSFSAWVCMMIRRELEQGVEP